MHYLSWTLVMDVVDSFVKKYLDPLLRMQPTPFKRPIAAIVVCDRSKSLNDMFLIYARLVDPTNFETDRDFLAFAYAKALLATRTGMSTLDVVRKRPDLIQADDFAHPGAVVNNNLIVAVSGLDGLEDHIFSTAIQLFLDEALWKAYSERPQGGFFVGENPQQAGAFPDSLNLSELDAYRRVMPT